MAKIDVIQASDTLNIYHIGPPLSAGPLPSLIYFSLSGEESLKLHPYNQPALAIAEQGFRVFSITLPGHEGVFPHTHAIKTWSEKLDQADNAIDGFTQLCIGALDFLIDKGYADPKRIGTAGLSRGAFIATHFAAKDRRIHTVLGFAPLTRLETIKDFTHVADPQLLSSFSLDNIIPQLTDKTVRFYIGNHDTMVNTSYCFSFIQALTENIYLQKHRFPPVELIIYPSIGHKGHGTPPEIFLSGSNWLAELL